MEWSESDAAEELLQKFLDTDKGADAETSSAEKKKDKKQTPPEPEADDEEDEDEETPSEDSDDEEEGTDDDDSDEEESDGDKKYAEDGAYIKFTVDGEQKEISVKEVARLAGQEAALTKKSMEVAEQRKSFEANEAKNIAATQALLARAEERFKPYANIDFNLLATQLTPEEYQAVRAQAQERWEDREFLRTSLDGYMNALHERSHASRAAEAQEALKVLAGPADKGGIEGWSQKLYDEVRSFAVSYGIPVEAVNQAIAPWSIRLMHDAMLYARGRAKTAEVKTVKVKKQPKKIVKTSNAPATAVDNPGKGKGSQTERKALKNLQASGNQDDAAELLLARWAKESD